MKDLARTIRITIGVFAVIFAGVIAALIIDAALGVVLVIMAVGLFLLVVPLEVILYDEGELKDRHHPGLR